MMPFGVSWKCLRIRSCSLLAPDLAGAEGIDQHADRLGDADGIGELHFAALGQAGGHDVLGDVARHVGGGTVHLGRVLAAESAAAVTAHAAVGVDDDLASGQAGVAHGAADDEAAGGVDVVLGVGIQQVGGDGGLDHVLQDVGPQLFIADRLGMLRGDDHGIDPRRLAGFVVLDRDLRFAVGTQIGSRPFLRTCERRMHSLWASEIGVGMYSGVSLVA